VTHRQRLLAGRMIREAEQTSSQVLRRNTGQRSGRRSGPKPSRRPEPTRRPERSRLGGHHGGLDPAVAISAVAHAAVGMNALPDEVSLAHGLERAILELHEPSI
jgi:hypothetical protein